MPRSICCTKLPLRVGSYALHRRMNIREQLCMEVQRWWNQICDRIIFNFYTGLPSLIGSPTGIIYIIMSRNSPRYYIGTFLVRGILKSLSAVPVCWCLWGAQVRRALQDLLFTVFFTLQEAVQHSKDCYPITADYMKTTSNCHTKDNVIYNKNILTTKLCEKYASYEGLHWSFIVRPWVSTNHIL